MTSESLTARQASAKLNVPSRDIRTYCSWGLLKNIKHNRAGRRIFSAEQLEQIALLYGLQKAGFGRKELKSYAHIKDAQVRKSLLSTQKRQLWLEITERQRAIDFIERQEELLEQREANKVSTAEACHS